MGSGRGDRNQGVPDEDCHLGTEASMGSGRGDRNQNGERWDGRNVWVLQWGPVVVTGIRRVRRTHRQFPLTLQWGPVVVTGISEDAVQAETELAASMGSGRGDRNQTPARGRC